jgi:hypothetical protein
MTSFGLLVCMQRSKIGSHRDPLQTLSPFFPVQYQLTFNPVGKGENISHSWELTHCPGVEAETHVPGRICCYSGELHIIPNSI